jgi:hypothetical protein
LTDAEKKDVAALRGLEADVSAILAVIDQPVVLVILFSPGLDELRAVVGRDLSPDVNVVGVVPMWFPTRSTLRGASRLGLGLTLVVLVMLGCGSASPGVYWTVEQAESIKRVRGTALETTTCKGVGKAHASRYRRFSCVGVIVPPSAPNRPVRVRYVLNTRGKYEGDQSSYLATRVYFDAFGVP